MFRKYSTNCPYFSAGHEHETYKTDGPIAASETDIIWLMKDV